MKRLSVVLPLVLVGTLLIMVGCVDVHGLVSPGPTVTRDYDYKDFSNIEISSAIRADVIQSDSYSISISANEDLFDHIQVSKSGDTLKIFVQWEWGIWNPSQPSAKIGMPKLTGLKISGASTGSVTGFKSQDDLRIILSGASSLDVNVEAGNTYLEVSGASKATGNLKAREGAMEINGASRVELTGSGDSMNLNVSGASKADLAAFAVNDVRVTLSGASKGIIAPNGKADVYLSGASSLDYTGNPEFVRLDISGASTINKKT